VQSESASALSHQHLSLTLTENSLIMILRSQTAKIKSTKVCYAPRLAPELNFLQPHPLDLDDRSISRASKRQVLCDECWELGPSSWESSKHKKLMG